MDCPECGCETTYKYDDPLDELNDDLERCAACGHIFDIFDDY